MEGDEMATLLYKQTLNRLKKTVGEDCAELADMLSTLADIKFN